jgi:hypothetical protein
VVRGALLAATVCCAGCQLVLGIDPDVAILDGGATEAGSGGLDAGDGDAPSTGDGADIDDTSKTGDDGDPKHDASTSDADADGASGCETGTCGLVVLAHATGTPTDIAIDSTYVFWSNDDGSVWRVGKNGAGATALVSGLPDGIGRIAIDSTSVYFTTQNTGVVYAVGKDGSSRTTIAISQGDLEGVAAGLGGVYWLANSTANNGTVVRGILADGGAYDITTVYPGRGYLNEMALDGQNAYWGENYGQVQQAPGDGGTSTKLAGCSQGVGALAVDATRVYWSSTGLGEIYESNKNDPAIGAGLCNAPSRITLAVGEAEAHGVAVAGTRLFWTSSTSGAVKTMPVASSCSAAPCGQVLANGHTPGPVAADSQAVYWVNAGDKTVEMVGY